MFLWADRAGAGIQSCVMDPAGQEISQATAIEGNINMKFLPWHEQGCSEASCQNRKLQKVSQPKYLIFRNQQTHKKFISVHSMDLKEGRSKKKNNQKKPSLCPLGPDEKCAFLTKTSKPYLLQTEISDCLKHQGSSQNEIPGRDNARGQNAAVSQFPQWK